MPRSEVVLLRFGWMEHLQRMIKLGKLRFGNPSRHGEKKSTDLPRRVINRKVARG